MPGQGINHSMDRRAIPQSQIPHTSRLFQDYLYDYQRVSEFYPLPPFEPASFAKSGDSLRYPDELRQAVVSVLRERNETLAAGPATMRSLDRLAKPGCCA